MTPKTFRWRILFREEGYPDVQRYWYCEESGLLGEEILSRMTEKEVSDMCVYLRKMGKVKVTYDLYPTTA